MSRALGLGAWSLSVGLALGALALGQAGVGAVGVEESAASSPPTVPEPAPVAITSRPDRLEQVLKMRQVLEDRLRRGAEASNSALGYGPEDARAVLWDAERRELRVRDEAWFASGQPELSPDGRRAVADLLPRLTDALLEPEVVGWVGGLRLEAHADPRWGGRTQWTWESWSRNGELSQKRIAAILRHLGTLDEARWRPTLALLIPSSRSWSEAWCGGRTLGPVDFAQAEPCPQERGAEEDQRSRGLTLRVLLSERVLAVAAEAP